MRLNHFISSRGIIVAIILLSLVLPLANSQAISACTNLNSPGAYELTTNITGGIGALSAPAVGGYTCIRISSSNVTLDCAGHTITNNGTASSQGIMIGANSGTLFNIAVKNCEVSQFETGIYTNNVNDSIIESNTVHNADLYGMAIWRSANTHIKNNIMRDSFGGRIGDGLLVAFGTGNTINSNQIYGNRYGISVGSANNITYSFNDIHDNSLTGIRLERANSNTLFKNNIHNNAQDGIQTSNGNRNNLTANALYDNAGYGGRMDFADAVLEYNEIYSNGVGLLIGSYNNNSIKHNLVHDNRDVGIAITSSNTTAENNTVYGHQRGVYLALNTIGNKLISNKLHNNPTGFDIRDATNVYVSKNVVNGSSAAFSFTTVSQSTIFRNYINSYGEPDEFTQQASPAASLPEEAAPTQQQTPTAGTGGGGGTGTTYIQTIVREEQILVPLNNQQIQQLSSPSCTSGSVLIGSQCISIAMLGICGDEVHVKTTGKCCSGQWFEGAVICPTSTHTSSKPAVAGPIKSELPIIASIGLGLMLVILSIAAYLFMKKKPSLRKGKNNEQTATKLVVIVGLSLLLISAALLTNTNNSNSGQTGYATLSPAAYATQNGFTFYFSSNNNVTGNIAESVQTGFTFYSSSSNTVNGNSACGGETGFDFNHGAANNAGTNNFGKATGEIAGNNQFETQNCPDAASPALVTG